MKKVSESGERTYFFYNLGCPKNLVDAESVAARLQAAGWREARDPRRAGLLVVTTCAFIAAAEEESIEQILEVAAAKRQAQRLAVLGCLVAREGGQLARLLPEVDVFLDVASMQRLPQVLAGPGGGSRHGRCLPPQRGLAALPPPGRRLFTPPHLAYLKIAEGCSNRCAYCTIPAIRGPLTSRPAESLLAEARALAAAGVRELVLVAQDTTAWGCDRGGDGALYGLLELLSGVAGIDWMRLMYLHPARVDTRRLIETINNTATLPYLDMPIQHVSDRILRRMGRGYGGADVERIFDAFRAGIDGLVLRTTVMTGFPGETEEDFRMLVSFLERCRIDHVGIFPWSNEHGTRAARLRGRVDAAAVRERCQELAAVQMDVAEDLLGALPGRTLPVIVDRVAAPGEAPRAEFMLEGRWYGQAPEVDGVTWLRGAAGRPGSIVEARIEAAEALDLFAVTG